MILAFLLLQAPTPPTDSAIVSAVRAAVQREPVEAFGNTPGLVRVRDIVLFDVDGDGRPEAFVSIEPQVRQTPTVIVYSYDPEHGARHLLEGLVPGSPQPVSGRLVDDHTMGYGLDLTFDAANGTPNQDLLVANGVNHHMSEVFYGGFLHADGRAEFLSMADLAYWKLPQGTTTCNDFEFSPVDALVAGPVTAGGRRYLIALTNDAITFYRFKGLQANGMLKKQVWVRPRPADAVALDVAASGIVGLRARDGQVLPLPEPQ